MGPFPAGPQREDSPVPFNTLHPARPFLLPGGQRANLCNFRDVISKGFTSYAAQSRGATPKCIHTHTYTRARTCVHAAWLQRSPFL